MTIKSSQSKKTLRFAPVIRVSTEKQEAKGESLRLQRRQIQEYVNDLGGYIPEHCWVYSGQEHATPKQERAKLDLLLEDAAKDIFDAVIVCDPSRWSRDNARSKEALEILKKHRIKFYVGKTEKNLNYPPDTFDLGIQVEVGEYCASILCLRSIENRILRAKRNIPTAGKVPYGRIFDRKSEKWSVDDDKKRKIEYAADQYLNKNRGLYEISAELGMNTQNLWNILRNKCGDKWEIEFASDRFNINEVVEIKVPRLLPDKTIRTIHEKLEANKTYSHGHLKNHYLLSRMIFCNDCGMAMVGQTNHGIPVYKHQVNKDILRKCPNYYRWTVRAEEIEEAVILHLFSMYGDITRINDAIKRAMPSSTEIKRLQESKEVLEKEYQCIKSDKKNLLRAIQAGNIAPEDPDVRNVMDALRQREDQVEKSLRTIESKIKETPTEEDVLAKSKRALQLFKRDFCTYNSLLKMTYERKRNLVEHVFAGKDPDGRRLGVYLSRNDETISYSIRGIFQSEVKGKLPLDDIDKEMILPDWIPPDFDPRTQMGPDDFISYTKSKGQKTKSSSY